MGDIEAFDALGRSGKIESGFERVGNGLGIGLEDAEALLERVARVFLDQIEEGMLGAALGGGDFHAAIGQIESGGAFGENFFKQRAVFEIAHDVNGAGKISRVEIELLEHGREEFVGIEFFLVLPVEIAAVNDAAGANVEEIHGDLRRFGIPGEHVGIVAGGGSDFLALFDLLESAQEIAVTGGLLVALVFGSLGHARAEADQKIVTPAFEEGARVAGGLGIFFVGSQAGNARTPATVNIKLKAGARMRTREVHGTGRNAEMFVNEMDDAVGEAVGEEGAEIDGTVFAQASRDVDAGKFLEGGEADVRISLVVAEQDIELGLILLDEIIFEREGFAFVIHNDVIHIGNFAHQRAGFGVGPARFQKIRAHAGAQGAGLADIQGRPQGVLKQIDTGIPGKIGDFFAEFHAELQSKRRVPEDRESRASGNIHDSKANHTCENDGERLRPGSHS